MRRSGALMLAALLWASPAAAHNLRVFATVEADTVSGYAYYAGGGRAAESPVHLLDDAGQVVAETRADAQGAFRFDRVPEGPLRVRVNTGDGHEADYAMRGDSAPAAPARPMAAAAPDLEALIERAVARQIRPLQEQLDQYSNTVRWHDVLGGVGYILGLTGLLAYVKARRPGGGA